MNTGKTPLSETIAREIRENFKPKSEAGPMDALPSIADLCREFRVSRPTMIKAVHLLRREGFLEFHRGRRIRWADRIEAQPPPRISAERALYLELKTWITNGSLRTGQPLPKQSQLAFEKRLSTHTVCKAYARLMREKLIYKQGMVFYAGIPNPATISARSDEGPVILILTGKPQDWAGICTSNRTRQFGQSFLEQANGKKIRIMQAYVKQEGDSFGSIPWSQVPQMRDGLGTRYMGTLVAGSPAQLPGFDDIVRKLLGYKRPVVWLDRNDEGWPAPRQSPFLTRCHFTEAPAIQEALITLAHYGHERVDYICERSAHWQMDRAHKLQALASECHPSLQVKVHYFPDSETWKTPEKSGLLTRLEIIQHWDTPKIREAAAKFQAKKKNLFSLVPDLPPAVRAHPLAGFVAYSLHRFRDRGNENGELSEPAAHFWHALDLFPILASSETTAIIFSHDNLARSRLRWLNAIGFRAPRHFSVISFDHSFSYSFFPLTSVDFGFGNLGYQAFHALLQDIPVARNRRGDIAARPFVVDRGSVGSPRPGTQSLFRTRTLAENRPGGKRRGG